MSSFNQLEQSFDLFAVHDTYNYAAKGMDKKQVPAMLKDYDPSNKKLKNFGV